jgi:prefoldin subunit 5
MNDIDERLQKLEEAVWKLGADIGMMRRTIDPFLMGIQMNYIDERLQKLEKKIRDMRGEIEKLLSQHPELREVYETRR